MQWGQLSPQMKVRVKIGNLKSFAGGKTERDEDEEGPMGRGRAFFSCCVQLLKPVTAKISARVTPRFGETQNQSLSVTCPNFFSLLICEG